MSSRPYHSVQHDPVRRRCAAAVAGALLGVWRPAAAQGRVELARATDLPRELARALAAGRPLIVMVSLDGCPFCREVRDSHLGPLRDAQRQPMVQLDMRSPQAVVALDGTATTHGALIRTLRASVAPTLLFIGPGGREVAQRLSGFMADFYGAYLDDRLDVALKAVKG